MTDNQADKLVLEKWDILRNSEYSNGILIEELPKKFLKFSCGCAWCEKYFNKNPEISWDCDSKCPLIIIDDCCNNINSIYDKWLKNRCQRTANNMYKQCQKAIKARSKK